MANRRNKRAISRSDGTFIGDIQFLAVLTSMVGAIAFVFVLVIVLISPQIIPFCPPGSVFAGSDTLYSVVRSPDAGQESFELYAFGGSGALPHEFQQEDVKFFPRLIAPPNTVSAYPLSSATCNMAYSVVFVAKGGHELSESSIVGGALPPGLSLTQHGVIEGIPKEKGLYKFTIKITDAQGSSGLIELGLTVLPGDVGGLSIFTDSLPEAIKGRSYRIALATTGGTGPYKWTVRGDLPPGLNFDPNDGIISGKPMSTGVFPFEVTVKDELSVHSTRLLSISVIGEP